MSFPNLNDAKGLLNVGRDADVRIFTAGGTITRAGDWVKFDIAQTGETRSDTVVEGTASTLTFGVALETATVGLKVRVLVGGYVEGAQTDDSVVSGGAVVAKAAGEVGAYAAADVTPILGVALENDAGADPFLVDMIVFKHIA